VTNQAYILFYRRRQEKDQFLDLVSSISESEQEDDEHAAEEAPKEHYDRYLSFKQDVGCNYSWAPFHELVDGIFNVV